MAASLDTDYAGDVEVEEAYKSLSADENSVLVDVRTDAEWSFVGVPDLSELDKDVFLCEWQSFPNTGPNPEFVAQLSDALKQKKLDQNAIIYFLCRSGVRSKSAAAAMTSMGYRRCYNVTDGFEGPLDARGHRGLTAGWKAKGFPWRQT